MSKILFITLSNIGDCIMSLPALDYLKRDYPDAKITVMVGERPKEIFENNPNIAELIIYHKHSGFKEKIVLFNKLRQEKFDMVFDLRNSLFGALLPARAKISPFLVMPKEIKHMKDRHLYKIRNPCLSGRQAKSEIRNKPLNIQKSSLYIKPEDEEYVNSLLKQSGITDKDKVVVISPGGRSQIKRWSPDKFLELISSLVEEFKAKVILAGDKDDVAITEYIVEHSKYPVVDLAGKTSIAELACLLKNADVVVTNDSAVLHLASYLDRPTVAIFGPTNELKYGPWSKIHYIIKKDIFCRPCEKAQCRFADLKCMQLIGVQDVLKAIRSILITSCELRVASYEYNFKRILIVRTDRIGDVLLSTPVIKVLRETYPHAYIAMMVSPYAKDIVEGNPYLDEVIIYDKEGKHRSWRRSLKFARNLKKKRFDLALILHPTNRVHLVTFFAGIPRRVGYDLKLGFLLTDRVKHTKQLGEKHELEYNLDLARYLGIEPQDKNLFMPIKQESGKWVKELFRQEGIKDGDKLLAVNPAASCPSKVWPAVRFAEAIDRLIEKYGFKVLVLCGPKDMKLAQELIGRMHKPAINLAGKTSVSQLASLLERCRLFISNDSGPVHVASAVGTPVISIFSRAQAGLSPQRWGPRGIKDIVLHKKVGCVECLAHNCTKELACLKAITVEDVLNAADAILKS